MSPLLSERGRRLATEGVWVATGQGLAILGTLVGVRLLTRQLEPAAYGELALGMTAWTLLNQTVMGALASGITRFYAPAAERGELGGYLGAVRGLVRQTTTAIAALALIGVTALAVTRQAGAIPLAIAALAYAVFAAYASFLNVMQNAARHRALVALHQALDAWARFLIAVALATTFGATSTNAMTGFAIGAAFTAGSQYLFFRTTVARRISSHAGVAEWRQSLLDYSWPFAVWGIFSWAQLASDRWALELYATTDDVGLYSLLYQLGYSPIALATGMVMQFLSPVLFQRAGDATDGRRTASAGRVAYRLTAVALLVTAAAFVLGLVFHRHIFRLLTTGAYTSISYLLPWVMLGGGLFAAGQTIALNLLSQLRAREMMTSKIITAVVGTALNFLGAHLYGIPGVVIAGVIFSASYFVWMLLLVNSTSVPVIAREASA